LKKTIPVYIDRVVFDDILERGRKFSITLYPKSEETNKNPAVTEHKESFVEITATFEGNRPGRTPAKGNYETKKKDNPKIIV
jgi:hypothetical protein